ncbi:hypothetical protein AU476_15065 [Cupriavidus sp. UYMSc13B]|nr:hypothetical protein AU476_15065 [Cupriavidus sp. UYMSc13B]
MHSDLKTIALTALGVATGQALAGPDWDVINRARAAAQQPTASASKEAQLARCDAMMRQMDSRPARSGGQKGSSESK